MLRGRSFPLCVDWLPDGRLVVVCARPLGPGGDGCLEPDAGAAADHDDGLSDEFRPCWAEETVAAVLMIPPTS